MTAVSRRGFLRKGLGLGSIPFLVSPLVAAIVPARADAIRYYRAPDSARIVIDLNKAVDHKVSMLAAPDRVVIDIQGMEVPQNLALPDFGSDPILGLRMAKRNERDCRLVFDLKKSVTPKSFLLNPEGAYGYRLVIDLHDKASAVETVKKSAASSEPRKLRVAIDPGHGGEDPGAVGRKGTREKDVVMKVARELVRQMKHEKGLAPYLIRDGDYYVALNERRRIAADKFDADIFISIHADAFTHPQANGASVFSLSEKGASSVEAAFIAEMENNADRVGGVAASSGDTVFDTLTDLLREAHLAEGAVVGGYVLAELKRFARLHKQRVEQAGFLVLKNSKSISFLVETGFISNPQDEQNLRSENYQQRLANAILSGVKRYCTQYPNVFREKTWFSVNDTTPRHEVSLGETWSSIAAQHGTTVSELLAANDMITPDLKAGMSLRLPQGVSTA